MHEMIARASRQEIQAADRTLRQREQWAEISRVERLERALKQARSRIFAEPHLRLGAR